MKYYGITCNGKLMGISCSGNDDNEYCNSYSCELDSYESVPWLTPHESYAKTVLEGDVHWFNSSIDTPILTKNIKHTYAIVEVSLKIKD